MNEIGDDLLPSAQDLRKQIALAESEKVAKVVRERAALEAAKQALIEQLKKPSGISDEDCIKHCAAIIKPAVSTGLTEVEVYRFPNDLCTDGGRRDHRGANR